MNISLTESKLLEILTEGLKHIDLNGISLRNTKVTDITVSSNWDDKAYMLTIENDYPHW